MSFADLGLSTSILRAVEELGYKTPSPIQTESIPAILAGRDVMSAAQTGTGKTAGFTLPLLDTLSEGDLAQANQVRALVITPTRELAAQVAESVAKYGKYTSLRSTVVFGGVKINPQMMKLRKGADILVATPGRLMDLYQQNAISFKRLEVLVLDEADRMLDMGFIHDIRKILAILPPKRQNLLFSATFSEDIRRLAKGIVNNPVEIAVNTRNSTAAKVKQWMIPVDKKRKAALLQNLIINNDWQQVLVFGRTKHGANKLTGILNNAGIHAAAIHGNKSQGARTKALADFKSGAVRVLVATDIAARGLDISQLPQVVNFDLPQVAEDYVHRIGRTGRAGAEGEAVSLVAADEHKLLIDIERLTQALLSRETIDGFEPEHEVPASRAPRPIRPSRPKKPRQPRPGTETEGRKQNPRNNRGKDNQNTGNSTQRRSAPVAASTTEASRSGRGTQKPHGDPKIQAQNTNPNQRSAHPKKNSQAKTGPANSGRSRAPVR